MAQLTNLNSNSVYKKKANKTIKYSKFNKDICHNKRFLKTIFK